MANTIQNITISSACKESEVKMYFKCWFSWNLKGNFE